MENFYDKLKDKMGDYPETPTDWNAWDDISKELHPEEKSNVIPFWVWLPLGLITTGLLGYWLGISNSEIPNITQSTNTIDTIYLTNTETINDTVYREEYITQWKYRDAKIDDSKIISSATYQNLLASKQQFENQLYQYQNTISKHPIANHPSFVALPGLRDLINKSDLSNHQADPNRIIDRIDGIDIETLSPLELALLESKRRLIAGLDVKKYPIPTLKPSKSFLDQIIPDYVNIGASIEGPFFSFTQKGDSGIEFGGGLHTELLFSRKFSIVTGLRSRNNKTFITDEPETINYPQPIDVNPGETFKGLSIKSNFLDIPLHLKYKYSTRGIEKYIIAGILASKVSAREYLYEFYTSNGETYREVKGGNSTWTIGTATLGLGFEYGVSNSINLFAEPHARFNFKTVVTESDKFHGLGIRLGLAYEL